MGARVVIVTYTTLPIAKRISPDSRLVVRTLVHALAPRQHRQRCRRRRGVTIHDFERRSAGLPAGDVIHYGEPDP